MIKMKFLFLFIIFSNIRGKEEITEFNDFITISKGDSFDFTVKETESIVYFESLDNTLDTGGLSIKEVADMILS